MAKNSSQTLGAVETCVETPETKESSGLQRPGRQDIFRIVFMNNVHQKKLTDIDRQKIWKCHL
jgi:hypothetical protein